ncbi:hypothetical protein [Thermomonas sp. XSG]|uniref:hypothetical protein n=1 Tax=Thermomonas sp. XSG TaxID=2771436 RepID=UPI001681612D|nr:hypothetical protein [Thermomonas sp. XSG]QNU16009.1 hypothetical protein ICG51_002434 [Thermomonas sp. XSG]
MSALQNPSPDAGVAYMHSLMDRARPRWENVSEGVTADELQQALDDVADYMDRTGNSEGEHYMAWMLRMARTMVMRTNDRHHAALVAINRGDAERARELLSPVERFWSQS